MPAPTDPMVRVMNGVDQIAEERKRAAAISNGSELSATPETIRSRIVNLAAKAANATVATDERHARQIADKVGNLLDWIPGIGNAIGAEEGAQQFQQKGVANKLLGGTGVLLSVLPGGKAGSKLLGGTLEEFARDGVERSLQYTAHNGDMAFMHVKLHPDGMAELSLDPFSKRANRFGAGIMRAGAEELKRLYPEIKGFYGLRQSGANPGRTQTVMIEKGKK